MRRGLLLAKGVRIKVQAPYWGVRRQLQDQEGLFSASGLKRVLSSVQGVCMQIVQTCARGLTGWAFRGAFGGQPDVLLAIEVAT